MRYCAAVLLLLAATGPVSLKAETSTLYISDSISPGCLSPTGNLIKVGGDGSNPTTIASLSPPPTGVAADPNGNAFVVQACGKSVSKVTPAGAVSVVFSGSPLQNPAAIALDASGNLIVGDNATDSVFRITPSGSSIVEVAKLTPSPGDAQDIAIVVDTAGNYIVTNDDVGGVIGTSQILRITPGGSVTTLFTGSSIQSITGIAIDSNGSYVVSDFRQSAVFRVTPSGAITTVASGPALCCNLSGIARDPASGNFIGTLNFSAQALIITPGGSVSSILSGSPLQHPTGVAVWSGQGQVCAVHFAAVDQSNSNHVIAGSAAGAGCTWQFTITNLQPYLWANFTVTPIGFVTAQPADAVSKLYAQFGVLAPGKSVTYLVQFTQPHQSVTVFNNVTLNGTSGIMNVMQGIIDGLSVGSPVGKIELAIEDVAEIVQAFSRMPNLTAAIEDFSHRACFGSFCFPEPDFAGGFAQLIAFSANAAEVNQLAVLLGELGVDLFKKSVIALLETPGAFANVIMEVVSNVNTALYGNVAGSVALTAQ